MAIQITCVQCGKTDQYHEDQINMSGNIKTMTYSVPCTFCGKVNTHTDTLQIDNEALKRVIIVSVDD